MSPRTRISSRLSTTVTRSLAAALLLGLLPGELAAAPQAESHEVHREVMVVGNHPTDHRIILGQMANRGYLGVHLLNLTPELRRHFGAAEDRGVLVSRIEPDSPAAEAGVEVGDLITTVDGGPLATLSQLVGRIRHLREGDRVELGIVRDGSNLTLAATLAQTQRRQIEVGKFVWRSREDGPLTIDLDPEVVERVITVDPESINETVSVLVQGLEAQGAMKSRVLLESKQREEFERRIAELEQRLLEMERQLRKRHDD